MSKRIPTNREFKVYMDVEQRDTIVQLMKDADIADRKVFLTMLLESFKNQQKQPSTQIEAEFSDTPMVDYNGFSEKQLIEKAKDKMSEKVFFHKAILAEAQRSHRAKSSTTISGTEKLRATNDDVLQKIHELVQTQMQINENATDWVEKRCINTSWIQCSGQEDEMGRSTHVNVYNFKTVKQYLQIYSSIIDAHHIQSEINNSHNMRVPKEIKRREKQLDSN